MLTNNASRAMRRLVTEKVFWPEEALAKVFGRTQYMVPFDRLVTHDQEMYPEYLLGIIPRYKTGEIERSSRVPFTVRFEAWGIGTQADKLETVLEDYAVEKRGELIDTLGRMGYKVSVSDRILARVNRRAKPPVSVRKHPDGVAMLARFADAYAQGIQKREARWFLVETYFTVEATPKAPGPLGGGLAAVDTLEFFSYATQTRGKDFLTVFLSELREAKTGQAGMELHAMDDAGEDEYIGGIDFRLIKTSRMRFDQYPNRGFYVGKTTDDFGAYSGRQYYATFGEALGASFHATGYKKGTVIWQSSTQMPGAYTEPGALEVVVASFFDNPDYGLKDGDVEAFWKEQLGKLAKDAKPAGTVLSV